MWGQVRPGRKTNNTSNPPVVSNSAQPTPVRGVRCYDDEVDETSVVCLEPSADDKGDASISFQKMHARIKEQGATLAYHSERIEEILASVKMAFEPKGDEVHEVKQQVVEVDPID